MIDYQDHTYNPYKLVRLQPLGNQESNGSQHRHKCLEIFFFLEPGEKHIIDFATYPVSKYEVHLIRPNGLHHLHRTNQTKGYVLLVSKEFFFQYARFSERWAILNQNIIRFGPVLTFDELSFSILQNTIELLFSTHESPANSFKEEQIFHLIEAIVLHILNAFQKKIPDTEVRLDKEEKISCKYTDLIETHFHEWHQIEDYTKKMLITSSKLYQCTKSTYNLSPIQLLHERIILEAKRLLAHSNASVKEISWNLGYLDDAYFNRFFKQKTGMTGTQFRKAFKA